MTTTTVTFPPSDRLRRRVVAVLASAAIVASAGLVVGRAIDRDASVGAPSNYESTLDRTFINGAIHVFTAPDETAAVSPGAATALPGIGDIVAGTAGGG